MRVAIVCSWLAKVCRHGAQKLQILEVLGVLRVCLFSWVETVGIKKGKSHILRGLGCDAGGNCVQLVVQSVPTWGSEVADSRGAWRAVRLIVRCG